MLFRSKRDYEHYNGYEKQKIQGYELYQQAFILLQDKTEQEIVTALFQEIGRASCRERV